QQLQST
ncbi:acyl-CoA dehydrogenase, N-terminal domain protein, partial [Vibrio parahaemolyticus EKP-021]